MSHSTEHTSLIETLTTPFDHKTFTVSGGQSLSYLAILQDNAQGDFSFVVQHDAHATIKLLCIGTAGHRIASNILTTLSENGAQADVYILSLLKDGSDINVHGNVTLAPDVAKVS